MYVLEPQLRTILRNPIKSGKDLVEKTDTLYSYLRLSKNSIQQMNALSGNEQYFHEIIRHLEILNDTMSEWSEGVYQPGGIIWSPDSQTTMQQFGKQREFVCFDGEKRRFSLHSKLMGAIKRIYFMPILRDKVVHIGYVGDHLPTTTYRT
jgi:hypothetical protein